MFTVLSTAGTVALVTDRRDLAVTFAATYGGIAGTFLFGTFCPLTGPT